MDSDHNTLTEEQSSDSKQGTSKSPPLKKPDEKLGTTSFVELLGGQGETYFIDKSLLLETFLTGNRRRAVVLAPRHLGKTILIDMMLHFLECQVDVEVDDGNKLTEEEFQGKLQETSNYKLFFEKGLKIMEKTDIVNAHFGRYPVIFVSFKCESSVASYKDALGRCKQAIQRAYARHSYLRYSSKLDDVEKDTFRKWCDGSIEEKNIVYGLQTLASCLHRYFDRMVVLLVDEYDSIITQSMILVKDREQLAHIVFDCIAIIKNAVEEDFREQHVQWAFITGVSGIGFSGSTIECYKFLQEHNFVDFYGLTAEEAEGLMRDVYQLTEEQIAFAKKRYDGYKSLQGKTIYSIWSLLHYAADPSQGMPDGVITGLPGAFRVRHIQRGIESQLLLWDTVDLRVENVMTADNVCDLAKVIRGNDPDPEFGDASLFFSFLVEQGYLTYADGNVCKAKIPNVEIAEQFKKKLMTYSIQVLYVNENYVNRIRQFFTNVCRNTCDHDDFVQFHGDLQSVVAGHAKSWVNISELNLRALINMLLLDLGFDVTKSKDSQNGKRLIDLVLVKDGFAFIFNFKGRYSYAEVGLDEILERQYLEVLTTNITHYVLMGVVIARKTKISICYLQDSKTRTDAKTIQFKTFLQAVE